MVVVLIAIGREGKIDNIVEQQQACALDLPVTGENDIAILVIVAASRHVSCYLHGSAEEVRPTRQVQGMQFVSITPFYLGKGDDIEGIVIERYDGCTYNAHLIGDIAIDWLPIKHSLPPYLARG